MYHLNRADSSQIKLGEFKTFLDFSDYNLFVMPVVSSINNSHSKTYDLIVLSRWLILFSVTAGIILNYKIINFTRNHNNCSQYGRSQPAIYFLILQTPSTNQTDHRLSDGSI